uniref:Uncharacterized protein n=1 Tax=Aegilops tauschii TaxID=37682 RepID=M8CP23_AEGTA
MHSAEKTKHKKSWIAPERGCNKVTVDGGLSRDGSKGAAAAVCRTEHDCLEMVTNYHKKALCHYSAILREVQQRASHLRQVAIVHEKRETTADAHNLAKAASSLDSVPDICCIPRECSS